MCLLVPVIAVNRWGPEPANGSVRWMPGPRASPTLENRTPRRDIELVRHGSNPGADDDTTASDGDEKRIINASTTSSSDSSAGSNRSPGFKMSVDELIANNLKPGFRTLFTL